MKRISIVIAAISAGLLSITAAASIDRVRVLNDSSSTIYIHVGGYASSQRLNPGEWRIYYYPFTAHPPGEHGKSVQTSLLVATAGGEWQTTSNGYIYLSKPHMAICLDYKNDEHKDKTGSRVWVIKQAYGFDKGCEVKGYQPLHNQ